MRELLEVVFGTHPRTVALYPLVEKTIKVMRENHSVVERKKLANELGLNLNDSNDKAKFYRIISPMLNKLIVSHSNRKAGKTYYHLSYDAFKGWLESIEKSAYYHLGVKEGR